MIFCRQFETRRGKPRIIRANLSAIAREMGLADETGAIRSLAARLEGSVCMRRVDELGRKTAVWEFRRPSHPVKPDEQTAAGPIETPRRRRPKQPESPPKRRRAAEGDAGHLIAQLARGFGPSKRPAPKKDEKDTPLVTELSRLLGRKPNDHACWCKVQSIVNIACRKRYVKGTRGEIERWLIDQANAVVKDNHAAPAAGFMHWLRSQGWAMRAWKETT